MAYTCGSACRGSPLPSTSLTLPILAGSSSLPLTTSGVYSEGVAHTCGRYGSVPEDHFFCVLCGPSTGLGLISYSLQLYSLTRVATLLFVILGMLGFDSTRPINCQVSPAPNVAYFLVHRAYWLQSQGLDHFRTREYL